MSKDRFRTAVIAYAVVEAIVIATVLWLRLN
jgi:hypothetical protein